MPSVAKNTFYLTAALVGQKILSFVYFIILARLLGAEMIGKYTFALAFTTIFSIIADLGLQPVIVREVARAKERAQEYLSTAFAVKLLITGCAYGIVLIAAYLLGYPVLTLQLIAIAGIVMMLDGFHLMFYGVLRGLQNLRYESIGMIGGQIITFAVGTAAVVLRLPLHMLLVALGLGSLWNVVFSAVMVSRQRLHVRPKFDRVIARRFIGYAIPFMLAGIFVKVYSYIDTVLLQHMKGDLEVGLYSVPYKITYAFQFLPMALSAAIYPALSNTWATNKARASWIFDRALLYAILLSLPIALGIAALAPQIILSVYGSEFVQSILPLQISIFGLVFIFLYFPVGALLNATNRQVVNTVCMGITMVTNVILNLFLIPRYGAVGASVAAVATNAFLWIATLLMACRILRPSGYVVRAFLKTLVSVLVMAAVVHALSAIIFWPLTIAIGGFVYGACIIGLRVLAQEDRAMIFKLIDRKPAIISSDTVSEI